MNNSENIFSEYINLDKGKIRIGGGNSLLSSLILEPLLIFAKDYPNIEISISNGLTDSLMQKLANGELDILVLNLPYTSKKYSNVDIVPLRKSTFSFFASKTYLKTHKINNISEIVNHKLILPKFPSIKNKILEDYCKKENLSLHANYEVSSSSIMKKLVLNDIGIGFANTESIKDIMDEVEIIKEIELGHTSEGIALLKKTMSNKATRKLAERIKGYYK